MAYIDDLGEREAAFEKILANPDLANAQRQFRASISPFLAPNEMPCDPALIPGIEIDILDNTDGPLMRWISVRLPEGCVSILPNGKEERMCPTEQIVYSSDGKHWYRDHFEYVQLPPVDGKIGVRLKAVITIDDRGNTQRVSFSYTPEGYLARIDNNLNGKKWGIRTARYNEQGYCAAEVALEYDRNGSVVRTETIRLIDITTGSEFMVDTSNLHFSQELGTQIKISAQLAGANKVTLLVDEFHPHAGSFERPPHISKPGNLLRFNTGVLHLGFEDADTIGSWSEDTRMAHTDTLCHFNTRTPGFKTHLEGLSPVQRAALTVWPNEEEMAEEDE